MKNSGSIILRTATALFYSAVTLVAQPFPGTASAEYESSTGTLRIATACAKNGVAMGGYDLVSYYGEDGAQKGKEEFKMEFDGVELHFENAEHLELFRTAPERYLPTYGGWCATAVARNTLQCPDYDNYSIINGQLFIFETTLFTNGKYVWMRDPEGFRNDADANYPVLLSEE